MPRIVRWQNKRLASVVGLRECPSNRITSKVFTFYSALIINYSVPVCLCVCPSVCLSVCLFVRPLARLENHIPNFTKFSVHVTCGSGSVLLWRQCTTLCTSGSVDDVTFSHNAANGA